MTDHQAPQRAASGPNTPEGSTDRCTPVSGPQGAAQASELSPAEQAALERARARYEAEVREQQAAAMRANVADLKDAVRQIGQAWRDGIAKARAAERTQ